MDDHALTRCEVRGRTVTNGVFGTPTANPAHENVSVFGNNGF